MPLVVRLPERRGAGARGTARVRLADLAPTLLEAAAIPAPAAMQGQTLLPLLNANAKTDDRSAYAETIYPRQAFGWSTARRRGAPTGFSMSGRRRASCTTSSPIPRRLGTSRLHAAGHRRPRIGADEVPRGSGGPAARRSGGSAARPRRRVDPAIAERLAALGYVGGSGGAPAADRRRSEGSHRDRQQAARGDRRCRGRRSSRARFRCSSR